MIGKIIVSIAAFFLFQATYAETCPSVKDIKSKHIAGWKAYDSDEGTPLSSARETEFKKIIEEFALAEWPSGKNKNNTIHCYYRDATGSSLEAYLAKDNVVPKNHQNYWYEVSGFMHCAAGMAQCEFDRSSLAQQKQLANR